MTIHTKTLSLLFLVSIAALAAAITAEFTLHLPPCILCLAQRVPFVLAIIISSAALTIKKFQRSCLLFLVFLFLINTGIAVFQVGEEQKWWGLNAAGNSEVCTVPNQTVENIKDLYASMSGNPVGDCAHPAWSWHGVTFAVLNAALCFALMLFAIYGAAHAQSKKEI